MAAVLPLVASLAPDIINLIVSLVHKSAPAAEAQLGAGTGPVKFTQVFSDVMTALQSAAAAGQIPQALPTDDLIKLVIQSAVSSMKKLGLLDSSAAQLAPASAIAAPRTLALHAGDALSITVS